MLLELRLHGFIGALVVYKPGTPERGFKGQAPKQRFAEKYQMRLVSKLHGFKDAKFLRFLHLEMKSYILRPLIIKA